LSAVQRSVGKQDGGRKSAGYLERGWTNGRKGVAVFLVQDELDEWGSTLGGVQGRKAHMVSLGRHMLDMKEVSEHGTVADKLGIDMLMDIPTYIQSLLQLADYYSLALIG